MKLARIGSSVQRAIRSNAPTILSALSISGLVTTGYLAHQAGYTTGYDDGVHYDTFRNRTKKEFIKQEWRRYIPPVVSGIATVGCIVAAQRTGSRRAAAAQAAFTVTERAFSEYREKIVEQLGANKEKAIRDELAQERVTNTAPSSMVVAGTGNVWCCELFTGRFFQSDMETLRKAQNDVNAKLLKHDEATLWDFYNLVGLEYTSQSPYIGWKSDKQMKLEFSMVMSPSQQPCIAFEYNYTVTV